TALIMNTRHPSVEISFIVPQPRRCRQNVSSCLHVIVSKPAQVEGGRNLRRFMENIGDRSGRLGERGMDMDRAVCVRKNVGSGDRVMRIVIGTGLIVSPALLG